MKIELLYPVRAAARDAIGNPVTAFGAKVAVFDIPDAAEHDYPMAIEFRSGRASETPDRYRMNAETGNLMRPAGLVSNVVKEAVLKRPADSEPGFHSLEAAMRAEYATRVLAGKAVHPRLGDPTAWSLSLTPRVFGEEAQGLNRISKTDVEDCRAAAQAFLSTCVIVNGVVWEPCQEPTLKVRRGNEAWTVQIGHHPAFAANWHTYYFAVDEFELACAWIDTLDEALGERPRHQPSMRLDPGYRVAKDGAVEDVRMLCEHVLERIAAADTNLSRQSPHVISGYAKLKRFITSQGSLPAEHDVDAAIAEVLSLVETEERGEIAYSARSLENLRDVKLSSVRSAIDLHIRRWEERPIHDIVAGPTVAMW